MSLPLTLHPTRRHPLTGRPLQAVGVMPNGKVIWPILGGDDTVDPATERPEGISDAEWEALSDPGKQAIARERAARQVAERALAASRARPAPPKSPAPAAQPAATQGAEPVDIAAIVQQAVAEAVKPFAEAEQRRQADQAHDLVRGAVTKAAEAFHDPSDVLAVLDLTKVTDSSGAPDVAKIETELKALAESKPHLVRDARRFAPESAGATIGGSAAPLQTKVDASLERMKNATGIKPR